MNIKTITTVDGVNTVDFGSAASRFYWIENLGSTTVYVSGNENIVPDGDNVKVLSAGCGTMVENLGGKVYILGAGKFQITNQGDKFCPFRNAPVSDGGVMASGNPVQIDGLQGGVPFSELTVSGDDIIGQELTVNVSGKNLMKPNKSTVTLNGITATMNDDGSVTLNGTATANTYIGMWNNLYARSIGVGKIAVNAIDGQSISTYFMGIDRREGSSYIDRLAQSITNNGVGKITQEDVDNNRHFYVWVFIAANYTSNNLVFRPQLELGSTATEYEPYHGSTTTITPTSNPYTIPNDIRQVDGRNVVSVSEGELSVTGVRKNAAVKKIWDKIDELTTAIIVSNGETIE